MEKKTIDNIVRNHDVKETEKHIVYCYILHNGIDYNHNHFLSEYFAEFVTNQTLLNEVMELGHFFLDEIAVDMELLIPTEDKKVNGAFFTPAYIVDFIIESIAPAEDAKVADISCGSGAFLLGIVRYFQKKYNKPVAKCIAENVFGCDILEYNITRCKLLLTLLALTNGETVEEDSMNLVCADSLKHDWPCKFDAIVGNPPYVKFQDMDNDTRNFLLNEFTTTSFGTFNLYFAFFELGLNLLAKDGQLGYITPNNYFTSLAGESLRTFFQQQQCAYKIIDFNSTKVFDVQTYTAISFLNKRKNDCILYDRIGKDETPQTFLNRINLTGNSYADLSKKKWRLLCGNERHNIWNIEHCGESIGSLFNICVGIATLKDDVYFIDPVAEDETYFYINKNDQPTKIEKKLTRPLVKISDAKKQEDIEANARRIIFPYTIVKGRAVAIDEETMKAEYPCCYAYLLTVKSKLDGRGKGKEAYSPFYSYGRTQGLNRRGIKLLTPTFSKVPRFLFDRNEQGFFTNGYGIYLRERQQTLFDNNSFASEENLDLVQKVLNSIVMQYYVEKTSVSIEGGYPCYQKNFIERFTIPAFLDFEMETLRSLDRKEDIDDFLITKYQLNLPLPKRCS